MTADRKPKFFYGYVVIAAGIITSLLMVGTYAAFGIFFKPLASELGWTRATTAGARSLAHLLFGFGSIVAGRLTDKFGPRVVLIGCSLFLGLGYLLMSQVSSIWQLYLFYGVIVGIGTSGNDIPVLSTVARWFVKRRGTATGIVKTGAGIGMLSIPLLANWLISSYGWRNAYVAIGLLAMIGVILAALFLKRDPEQVGQLPDGATKVAETESSIGARQFSLWEVLGIRQFWIFSMVWFSFAFCAQVVLVHTVPHVTDLGISATIAVTIFGAIGGFSILGRIGMGVVSDVLGNKSALIMALSFLVASLVLMQYAREVWLFFIFAAVYGIAHGSFFSLVSLTVAELFGLGSLGAILGAVFFIGTIGGAISPVLAGRIFDITGSYQPAFLLCLALSGVALILVLFLRPASNQTLRRTHS